MRIGTDICLVNCRNSGYMIMDFKKRDLIKNGKLDKNCPATFSVSNIESWNRSGTPRINHKDSLWLLVPVNYSWNDLMRFIKDPKRREQICAGTDYELHFDNPSEYVMLHLASDIHFHFGFE